MLNKIGILSDNDKVSISNLVVYVFLFIVGFRTLFSGATFSFHELNWSVSQMDLNTTLPLLFGLASMGHEKMLNVSSQTLKGSPNNDSH